MDSELINGAPSSLSAPNCRDLSKKKRVRYAKLKQYKMDARREQWLSQGGVNNKDCKPEMHGESMQFCDRGKQSVVNLEVRRREEEIGTGSIQHEIDLESPSNSPTSILLGSKDRGTNFTNSCSGSSTSSGGCCSGSITEEDEGGNDDTLDNWEAFADALAADEKPDNEQNENHCLGSKLEPEPEPEPIPQSGNKTGLSVGNSKLECAKSELGAVGKSRAWRPDDVFRPQDLPNLSKQHSFPATDRNFSQGGVQWAAQLSCPICFEDLDPTDSCFLPCLCGFRLCLFCYKRILEEDGRCPACRKPYKRDHVEAEPSVRLARSCSMISRRY